MNVRFEYLYRDAGNYKNWGEIIFSNHKAIDIEAIKSKAESALIDSLYFEAEKVAVPDLHFDDYDKDLDHDWHEVHSFDVTEESPNDLQGRDIEEFLNSLQSNKVIF